MPTTIPVDLIHYPPYTTRAQSAVALRVNVLVRLEYTSKPQVHMPLSIETEFKPWVDWKGLFVEPLAECGDTSQSQPDTTYPRFGGHEPLVA